MSDVEPGRCLVCGEELRGEQRAYCGEAHRAEGQRANLGGYARWAPKPPADDLTDEQLQEWAAEEGIFDGLGESDEEES